MVINISNGWQVVASRKKKAKQGTFMFCNFFYFVITVKLYTFKTHEKNNKNNN